MYIFPRATQTDATADDNERHIQSYYHLPTCSTKQLMQLIQTTNEISFGAKRIICLKM